jgi:hypothetical protein
MNAGSTTFSALTLDQSVVSTKKDEAFMTLLMAMTDTRKRIAILALLSFLAMC